MVTASPTTTWTTVVHPLVPASSPVPSTSFAPAPASSATSTASSRAPSPNRSSVRSRKPAGAVVVPPPPPHLDPTTYSDLDPDHANDELDLPPDITRPSLRKATRDALGLAGQSSANDHPPSSSRRTVHRRTDQEREVVVHEVLKTDTIASVTLRYGITQQALRKANRLWATDPIHSRRTLLIPLDACNLATSSGLERVARDENGDLTVWSRDVVGTASTSNTTRDGPVAVGRLVSTSTSSLETTAVDQDQSRTTTTTTNDFLAIWDDAVSSSSRGRPSLDSVTSSSSRNRDRVDSVSPPRDGPPMTAEPRGSPAASLSKRTLKVERLPASQLSFFPPSEDHNRNHPPVRENGRGGARAGVAQPEPTSQDLFFGPLANSLSNSIPSIVRSSFNKFLPASSSSPSSSSSASNLRSGSIALPLSRTSSPHRASSNTTNHVDHRARGRGQHGRSHSSAANATSGWGSQWVSGWNLDYFGGEEEQAAAANAITLGRNDEAPEGRGGRREQAQRRPFDGTGRVREGAMNGVYQNGGHERLHRDGLDGRKHPKGGGERRTSEIGLEQVSTPSTLRTNGTLLDS